ncbi:MAG: hypothetical protein NDJ90_08840 [Oligoflexia bacterium]|nr:hypothetical protein [Oligoflexia bacterium]
MKNERFESLVKQALGEKPKASVGFEAALFEKAEELLSKRRVQRATRKAEARELALAKKRWVAAIREALSRFVELLAVRPDRPATAAIFAVLLVAFLALQEGGRQAGGRFSYADLPPLPENNDFPARYDAQIQAERQAYEREVLDDQSETSGGI